MNDKQKPKRPPPPPPPPPRIIQVPPKAPAITTDDARKTDKPSTRKEVDTDRKPADPD